MIESLHRLHGDMIMGKPNWSENQIQTIKDEYASQGPAKLAERFGTTPHAVTAKARRLGVASTRKRPPAGFIWTDQMIEMIRTRYTKEGGQPLADELGLSIDCVRRKAHSLKVYTIAGHAVAGQIRAARNRSYALDYFASWSPNMAYVLGFLFADGCVTKNLLSFRTIIASRDEQVLWFMKKEMKSRWDIRRYEARINKKTGRLQRPQSMLAINSKVMVADLLRLGLKPRKTYNDDPFPHVPDEFLPDFVRGYLDGDGSVCVRDNTCSLSFVGSPRFIQGLHDRLVRALGLAVKQITPRGVTKFSQVAWSSHRDLWPLWDFLYPEGHGFCLERKKLKLAEGLSQDRPLRPWDDFEDEMMRRYYTVLPLRQLAGMLGRSRGAVSGRAKTLNIVTKRNS